MENATKALLMGAGILIGILILSLGVYLFNTFGGFASDTKSKVDANQLAKFNDKFLRYHGKKDLTIQDIITVKNYALENNNENQNYNWENDRASEGNDYIDVYQAARKDWSMTEQKKFLILGATDEQLLNSQMENEKQFKFTCEVKLNLSTGKVNKIYFYTTTE